MRAFNVPGGRRLDLAILGQRTRAEIAIAQPAEPAGLLAELNAAGGDPDRRERQIVARFRAQKAQRKQRIAGDSASEVICESHRFYRVEALEPRVRSGDFAVETQPVVVGIFVRPFEA